MRLPEQRTVLPALSVLQDERKGRGRERKDDNKAEKVEVDMICLILWMIGNPETIGFIVAMLIEVLLEVTAVLFLTRSVGVFRHNAPRVAEIEDEFKDVKNDYQIDAPEIKKVFIEDVATAECYKCDRIKKNPYSLDTVRGKAWAERNG